MRQRLCVLAIVLFAVSGHTQEPRPVFTLEEVMVPMRDGVRLQTVILRPVDQSGPLPILFRRTPYGVPERLQRQIAPNLKELAQDGYIFVVQNLRGRFKSEGTFELIVAGRPRRPEGDQRDDRRLRQHRLAGARTCRTTTARSACSACPTTA